MKLAWLVLSLALLTAPAAAQRDYFSKRAAVFSGRPTVSIQGTLLKATPDYLIIGGENAEQTVVWLTRYAELRKKHRGLFNKTRKVYIDELVPGTVARIKAVRDEEGRLLVKKATVTDTIQEFVPADEDAIDPTERDYLDRDDRPDWQDADQYGPTSVPRRD